MPEGHAPRSPRVKLTHILKQVAPKHQGFSSPTPPSTPGPVDTRPTQRQGRKNSATPVRDQMVVRSGFPPPRAYLRDSRRRTTGSPAMDTTSSTAPRTPNEVIRSSRKATDNKVAVRGYAAGSKRPCAP